MGKKIDDYDVLIILYVCVYMILTNFIMIVNLIFHWRKYSLILLYSSFPRSISYTFSHYAVPINMEYSIFIILKTNSLMITYILGQYYPVIPKASFI